MSTQWTAPGATGGDESDPTPVAEGPFTATASGGPGGPASGGPRRELTQALPLFPLRPLGLAEVFGAAVRIYRLRPKSVLGVAAAVYGVAFVIITLATGASMVPMFGDMQSMIEDTEATSDVTGLSSLRDLVLFLVSTAVTTVISLVSTALVTVALTRVALGEAVGEHVPTSEMWATMRRRWLPATAVSLLIGVLSLAALVLLVGLGLVPVLVLQEASWLTVVPIVIGAVLGALAVLWIWARTLLAVPALVLEDATVLGAIRRSLVLTRGRRIWRVLGTSLLVYLVYYLAVQVISGVFGTVAFVAYLVILLATGFEGVVAGVVVLTILTMLGSYAATFVLAPFLSSGFVAVYADSRMRHEAWDVELTRRARDAWAEGGAR